MTVPAMFEEKVQELRRLAGELVTLHNGLLGACRRPDKMDNYDLAKAADTLSCIAQDLKALCGKDVDPKDYPPDHPVKGDLGSVPL